MPHTPNPSTAASASLQGLVWNADLTLQNDSNPAAVQRREAIDRARASRPRTAQIEREIMIAVIVLYVLILGSFAGLHLYGEYAMPAQTEQAVAAEGGQQP
ncbi:hypothetical protein CCOS865_03888 [Pseudomonas reidholzensis]|uniref:Uncharacterized protein n=1 Tax=Pseudomonas reidholzensis TaxID=1785162 RepID=A0A383RX05_9PSED|nr:hypothetical protein [Pseudomonas reidholzensis]SYX91610.1 hypothetical protein CCOS865_03888 [Pseudomonas reidholzensis]